MMGDLDTTAELDAKSAMREQLYLRGGDGKFYLEVHTPDGGCEYIPADTEIQSFTPVGNGYFRAIRDVTEMARQREADSHKRYFDSLPKDPKTGKQAMKRLDALQRQFETMVVDRVVPPTGPNVERVKDEQFIDMMGAYRAAVARGDERESDFQPLSAYQHKLVTSSGKVIRPVFQGEVGMKGNIILVLETGYGAGDRVAVSGG